MRSSLKPSLANYPLVSVPAVPAPSLVAVTGRAPEMDPPPPVWLLPKALPQPRDTSPVRTHLAGTAAGLAPPAGAAPDHAHLADTALGHAPFAEAAPGHAPCPGAAHGHAPLAVARRFPATAATPGLAPPGETADGPGLHSKTAAGTPITQSPIVLATPRPTIDTLHPAGLPPSVPCRSGLASP